MGPIPFFLTFQAELKKVLDGWIRPKMADSRADFSFGQEEGEDHQAGAAAAKNRKISNCKLAPMTHTIICPTLTMTEKNGFFLLARARARTT